MSTSEKEGLTDEEQKIFQEFTRQTKAHLKTMSKNQLIHTCIALLIDNHNMKQEATKKEAPNA